jgi:hypothetical protein
MGVLTRMRRLAAGPRGRLIDDLTMAYHGETHLAAQLRAHAEAVPYPTLAGNLRQLAEAQEANANALRAEIERLGSPIRPADPAPPRSGRNYWERLTVDLDVMRAMSRRYIELAQSYDTEYPEAAALFTRLARDAGASGKVVRDLIARSDSHAVD